MRQQRRCAATCMGCQRRMQNLARRRGPHRRPPNSSWLQRRGCTLSRWEAAAQSPGEANGQIRARSSHRLPATIGGVCCSQVLAREGGECSEAEAWLHSSPAHRLLSAQDRDLLLCELRELQQAAGGAPMRPETPSNHPERRPQQQQQQAHRCVGSSGKAAAASRGTGPAVAAPERTPTASAGAIPGGASSAAAASSLAAAHASRPAPVGAFKAARSAAAAGRREDGRAVMGGSSLSWPAGLQQRAMEWWRRAEGWAALEGVSQGQAAAAALGAALVLYAAFAERRALALGVRRWAACVHAGWLRSYAL